MQSSLWKNLKERKIVQWAVGYLAGAYALLEVTDILGDDFGWPAYFPRVMAVLLGFGFLATLVLAWFHGERGHQQIPRSELAILILIAVVGVPVTWWVGATTPEPRRGPRTEGPTIGRLVAFDSASMARSIAVLPFDNMTGDPQNDYLAEGITEDIIAALGNNGELRVISRTSVMRYKDSEKTVPEIGIELGVGKVLEGSVRVQGGQVRIVVQLIEVATDAHIWSNTYDGELENIFALQTQVAQDIAGRLNAETSARLADAAPSATVDSAAYRMFAMGRRLAASNTDADRQRARVYFDSAIALDPEFARAYEAIAELDVPDALDLMGAEPAAEQTSAGAPVTSVTIEASRSENAAQKALSINPQLSGAQSSLALQQAVRHGDISRATESAMKAVAANPNDVRARSRYAQILAGSGQLDRALIELDTAMARDPFSARLATQMGELHFAMGHSDEALVSLRRAIDLDSTNIGARITLALVLNQHGETDEALEQIQHADAIAPDHPVILSTHGFLLGQAGREEEARALARRLEERARSGRIPGSLIAQVWSAVGDAARASEWLDRFEAAGHRAAEGRGPEGQGTRVFVSPTMRYMFSEMRDLPELRSKLDSMGFPVMVITTDSLRIQRPPVPPDSIRRRR